MSFSGEECIDVVPWEDSTGAGCDAYVTCDNGNWQNMEANNPNHYTQWANDNGVSARDACCRCGGGIIPSKLFYLESLQSHVSQVSFESSYHKKIRMYRVTQLFIEYSYKGHNPFLSGVCELYEPLYSKTSKVFSIQKKSNDKFPLSILFLFNIIFKNLSDTSKIRIYDFFPDFINYMS